VRLNLEFSSVAVYKKGGSNFGYWLAYLVSTLMVAVGSFLKT
jgi:hypothetical protein